MDTLKIHEIIFKLKELLKETDDVKQKELSLFISKVLVYIYSEPILKNEFEKALKKTDSKDYIRARDEFLKFLSAGYYNTLNADDKKGKFKSISVAMHYLLFRLPDKLQQYFWELEDEPIFSLTDLSMQLMFLNTSDGVIITSQKNSERLDKFRDYEFIFAAQEITLNNATSIFENFNSIKFICLKTIIKIILSSLIIFVYNQSNKNKINDKIKIQFTPREKQVFDLLKQGKYTGAEIADHFGISKNTANTHISRILSKSGVHSKRELREKNIEDN